MRIVVGLDLGYGNTKVAYQAGTGPVRSFVMPSGAAPIDYMLMRGDGTPNLRGGSLVIVDGERWAAGVAPVDIQGYSPSFTAEFSASPDWLALAHAALSRIDLPRIDMLVAGLPVNEYYSEDAAKREAAKARVRQRLVGVHNLGEGRTVEVKQVGVIPQPLGAFTDYAEHYQSAKQRPLPRDGLVLVVDPGHYSVDWVLVQGADIRHRSSGTNAHAGRALADAAVGMIRAQTGISIRAEKFVAAVSRGDAVIEVGSRDVSVGAFLDQACRTTVAQSVREIQAKLHAIGESLHSVVVAGGGAPSHYPFLKAEFEMGGTDVVMTDEPILANARGYAALGRRFVAASGQAAA